MAPPYGELAARLSIYPNRMKTMMIKYIKKPLVWVALVAVLSAYTPVRDKFTAAETQQIVDIARHPPAGAVEAAGQRRAGE